MMEKSLGIDLDSKTNKIITGTVSSEIIKSGGNMMNTTTLHYIENTEEIWTGPIHTHTTDTGNVVVMAGETHTSEPHPVLNQPILMTQVKRVVAVTVTTIVVIILMVQMVQIVTVIVKCI